MLHLIFIRLEYRLRPNIGFTLRGDLEVFTWIKSGALWVHCWGWDWHILGAIRAVATVSEAGEIFIFCPVNYAITDYPTDKFHEIWTQQRRSVSQWKLSEHNFENFTVRGCFSKNIIFSQHFNVLRLQAAWLQIVGNSLPNDPSTRCLVSTFTLESIKNYSPLLYKKPTQISGNAHVRYWVNQYAAVLPGWPTWKKSRLNWKMKISNSAENADITQLQARDTRHRRMRKWTACAQIADNFQPNTVLWAFHTIQPSSYVCMLSLTATALPKFIMKFDKNKLSRP